MRRWVRTVLETTAFATTLAMQQDLSIAQSGPAVPPPPPGRSHISLPPSYGATAMSSVIFAEAAYIASVGDFLESAAIARRHNAVAAEHEMRNAVQWVSTYFERRRLNREFRAQENPSYLEREQIRRQKYESLVTENFQTALGDDVTDKLNWMLRELAGMSVPFQFIAGGKDSIVDTNVDEKLSTEDIHHLRFTDGGGANGQILVFRADSAALLQTRWPRVLRGSEFDDLRKRFETTRDEVIKEVRAKGELTNANQQKVMGAVDDLCSAFNAAFPAQRQAESSATFALYLAGKRFLQSLALNVYRLIDTDDPRAFDGSYRFEGDSVADLVHHMYQYSLEFALPETGDEGVYRKLFFALRNIYKQLSPHS